MSETDDRVTKALVRFDRVMAVVDEKQGPVAAQARAERQRTIKRYGKAGRNAALGLLAISLGAIVVGLVTPIGLFGFLAAVLLAVAIAGLLFVWGVREEPVTAVRTDLPNGEMVQRFGSYLYQSRRALPAPAQEVVDQISGNLGTLKQTLERTNPMDPDAQDARRLMSLHLPGLIDRYAKVPAAYRSETDAEGKTIDQRLVEGLTATRTALGELSERLAKRDVDAFSTQGRFIESKYGQAD
ncbi:hypothetical protein [Sphingomonas sp. LHG3443-2]|uniref:hypothetical protein n=1 Tax=Sphingomonas sp. LHG3443-2 TaxID=2804639 RepID=UPI003CF5ABE0